MLQSPNVHVSVVIDLQEDDEGKLKKSKENEKDMLIKFLIRSDSSFAFLKVNS